jgi:hypothetical protein
MSLPIAQRVKASSYCAVRPAYPESRTGRALARDRVPFETTLSVESSRT